jgi:hypothetical protein
MVEFAVSLAGLGFRKQSIAEKRRGPIPSDISRFVGRVARGHIWKRRSDEVRIGDGLSANCQQQVHASALFEGARHGNVIAMPPAYSPRGINQGLA